MAISGSFEVEGKTFRFRKPHLGPVRSFNETLKLAQEGSASLADIYEASLSVVHDAVSRLDPNVTKEALAAVLDDDSLFAMQGAVMKLIGAKEADPGEAASP